MFPLLRALRWFYLAMEVAPEFTCEARSGARLWVVVGEHVVLQRPRLLNWVPKREVSLVRFGLCCPSPLVHAVDHCFSVLEKVSCLESWRRGDRSRGKASPMSCVPGRGGSSSLARYTSCLPSSACTHGLNVLFVFLWRACIGVSPPTSRLLCLLPSSRRRMHGYCVYVG